MPNYSIEELYNIAINRLNNYHEQRFYGENDTLLLISATYPGVWLEHVYDSIIYAKLFKDKLYIAKNTINLFIKYQLNGQLPCYVWDKNRIANKDEAIGYSEIQECVSFAKLCLMYYEMSGDTELLEKTYIACKKWVKWLENNRMSTNRGLIEMYVGYDTGHDNSCRLDGMKEKGYYRVDGILQNASVCPPNDEVVPILAVDMNANYYSSLVSLSKMADILNNGKKTYYLNKSKNVKELMFKYMYNKNDAFFYDVDKNNCV